MTLRHTTAAALVALALAITGCSSATAPSSPGPKADRPAATTEATPTPTPTPEQLDLTGAWSWHDAPDPDQTMTATITADRIEVFWPSFEGTEKPLYWAGSFTPPEPGEAAYTFTSVGDTAAMQKSMLASSDGEKEFRFADGAFSFDVTVQGQTKTITLERD